MPTPRQAAAEGLPSVTAATEFADLSFVSRKGRKRSCWNVLSSGQYGEDCIRGEELALEYLAFEETRRHGECPNYLNMIAEDMPQPFTGVEVGFFGIVTYAIRGGIKDARRVVAYWNAKRAEREVEEAVR